MNSRSSLSSSMTCPSASIIRYSAILVSSLTCAIHKNLIRKSERPESSFITTTMPSCAVGVLGEQLFNCQFTAEHSLLTGELNQILHVIVVFFEALLKRVFTEELPFFLQVRACPGKAEPMRLLHGLVVRLTRRHKCFVEAGGHPGVTVEDLFFDDDRVHDRENFGPLVVLFLLFLEFRKQSLDASFVANPAPRQIRFDLRIDLALDQ